MCRWVVEEEEEDLILAGDVNGDDGGFVLHQHLTFRVQIISKLLQTVDSLLQVRCSHSMCQCVACVIVQYVACQVCSMCQCVSISSDITLYKTHTQVRCRHSKGVSSVCVKRV